MLDSFLVGRRALSDRELDSECPNLTKSDLHATNPSHHEHRMITCVW